MKQLMALVAAALLIGAALPSFAQDETLSSSQKVILATMLSCCQAEAWFEAERRVVAELSQANFVVEVKNGQAKGERERRLELGMLAGESKAVCAFRLTRSRGGRGGEAHLWINNPATGKTDYRRVAFEGKDNDEDVSIFALRVTEALRAGLIELKVRSQVFEKPESQPEKPKDLQLVLQKQDSSAGSGASAPFSARLGAGVVGFPNEAGFLGTAAVAVRGTFIPVLSVELEGATSFPGKHIGAGAADSTFGVTMVRAWVMWEALADGMFRPSIGVGGGLLVASAEGADSPRFTGVTDRTSIGYFGANAQCAAAIWRRVWIRAGMSYGRTVPEVHISYGSAGSRTFGKPLIEGSAGVELKIP